MARGVSERDAENGSTSGGAVLGEGGQGRVSTISDLPDAVAQCPHVTLVTVDLTEARPRRTRVVTDKVVRRIAPFAVFKADLERPSVPGARSDARLEFELTIRLVCDLARAAVGPGSSKPQINSGAGAGAGGESQPDERRSSARLKPRRQRRRPRSGPATAATATTTYDPRLRRLADDIRRLTALLVLRGRIVVIGVIADACPIGIRPQEPPAHGETAPHGDSLLQVAAPRAPDPSYHPMLRRMEASLRDLSKRQPGGLSLLQLTDAVIATLEAMRLLDRCGARHGDIKEHNLLYDRGPDGSVKSYALCDFGYMRFPSDRLTPEGTEGSTSPLLFKPHHRDDFLSEFLLPEYADARRVWDTYEGSARTRSIAEQSLKNDLYSVGVMMGHVRMQLDRLPPPLQQVLQALLSGRSDASAIWTLPQALAAMRGARVALGFCSGSGSGSRRSGPARASSMPVADAVAAPPRSERASPGRRKTVLLAS